jgi:hypothetical protein
MSLLTPCFFESDVARKLWGKLSLCFSLWLPRNLPVNRSWMPVYHGSDCGIVECGTDVFEEPAASNLKRTIFWQSTKAIIVNIRNLRSSDLVQKFSRREEFSRCAYTWREVLPQAYLLQKWKRMFKMPSWLLGSRNTPTYSALCNFLLISELHCYTRNVWQIVHVDLGCLYINN